MSINTIVNVSGLGKTYLLNKQKNRVLKNVGFKIQAGEIVAIMGPSGSGKSTLLYAVSGMDEATEGKVSFLGKDISKLSKKESANVRLRDMGFIFQQMYMLKNLTVLDNIVLPAYQIKENDRDEKNEYAKELMEKLGISKIAGSYISEISGGELQRACICRSLINKPTIIFADEPTGSLNKQSSIDVMDEILKINKEGTAVLLVTHDMRVAAKSDRVLYLTDGSIYGEHVLGKYAGGEEELKKREKKLGDWLLDAGW